MTFAIGATEDLGGGLKAAVATNFDTTGTTFGSTPLRRNSSISLAGDFGSVAIVNTRSSDLLTSAMVAPSYLPDGMYDGSGIVNRTAVDVLQVTLPAMSGFTPYVQYVEANADGNTTSANKVHVLGVNYAAGALAGGVAYKHTTNLAAGAVANNTEAFVTYDLGVAKVGLGYDSKMNSSTTAGSAISTADAAKSAVSAGVSVPLGAMTVGVNYAKRGEAKVTEFAAKYDLSKRTALRFSSGKQNVDTSSQYRMAVVHAF